MHPESRSVTAHHDLAIWIGTVVPGTPFSVDTMRLGLTEPAQHIETLRRFKEVATG